MINESIAQGDRFVNNTFFRSKKHAAVRETVTCQRHLMYGSRRLFDPYHLVILGLDSFLKDIVRDLR